MKRGFALVLWSLKWKNYPQKEAAPNNHCDRTVDNAIYSVHSKNYRVFQKKSGYPF